MARPEGPGRASRSLSSPVKADGLLPQLGPTGRDAAFLATVSGLDYLYKDKSLGEDSF